MYKLIIFKKSYNSYKTAFSAEESIVYIKSKAFKESQKKFIFNEKVLTSV